MPSVTQENPLDKFASYSIHHIMLACRTTEEARVFIDTDKNESTLAAIDQAQELGDAIPLGKGNTAFLVIDTRRFSQFHVEKLQYEVLINGIEKAGAHGNLATKVDMTIIDNVGISFINFIQWLMNEKMETNFDGMIFMHRVVFVGHTPQGTTETVQSVTIPMHLFKLELALDATKGTYNVEFMPNMNFNVRDHTRWMNISDASRFFTGPGTNTLGSMIDSFEKQLNDASTKYFEKAREALAKAGRLTDGKQFGRLVQYQITIPKEWSSMKFTGAASSNTTETIHMKIKGEDKKKQDDVIAAEDKAREERAKAAKEAGVAKEPEVKDTHLSVETGRQITDVLDIIFGQVVELAELGAGKKTAGKTGSVTFYKHFVGITSDDKVVIVHVDVVPFEVPNVKIDKPENGTTSTVSQGDDKFYQELTEDGRRVPKSYMEFDYIFTGNNKDILNFDLKLQDLQFMLASQLNLGPGVGGDIVTNLGNSKGEDGKVIDQRAELIMTRPYDAILMPLNTEAELQNFTQYTTMLSKTKTKEVVDASTQYMRNLSMYYAMAPITVVMTIRGNPLIMSKFNQNKMLDHNVTSTTDLTTGQRSAPLPLAKPAYREAFEKQILKDNTHEGETATRVTEFEKNGSTFKVANMLGTTNYATMPVFVTVNIKGPKVDYKTGASIVGGDFAEKLLFDNFYVVFKVTNIIERNNFTQQLELYSHNIFGMGKLSPAQLAKAP